MTVTFQVKAAATQGPYSFSVCGTDGNLFVLSRMNNESYWIGDWKPWWNELCRYCEDFDFRLNAMYSHFKNERNETSMSSLQHEYIAYPDVHGWGSWQEYEEQKQQIIICMFTNNEVRSNLFLMTRRMIELAQNMCDKGRDR